MFWKESESVGLCGSFMMGREEAANEQMVVLNKKAWLSAMPEEEVCGCG